MTPERWRRIEELYDRALAREPGERGQFLAQACGGDEDLRREVESLLGNTEEADGFLERPALEVAARRYASTVMVDLTARKLGRYEVQSRVGRGGMGEVYRARDTRLKRQVALKVLPPERLADPERRRRFEQEARAASALDHPNIVTVHDIDQAQGIEFIAMEYVEGKTLAERIGRKGLPVPEALKYAVQIADALAAAHQAGIVHRDLKPGNVMVTEAGLVKVLDFGLAKLTEAGGLAEDESTRTLKAETAEGAIVGTVAYMSPEQAEGKKVDTRSDIFSFGSVLYEMVSGRRAFQGDTKISTLGAVINQEPAALSAEVPQDLAKLIARCLRKDPARRFQHMDDLRVALEELKGESDSGKLSSAATAPIRKDRRRLLAAVTLPLVAVAGWLVWRNLSLSAPPARVVALTTYAGGERYPSFSPDGKQVAFTWNGEREDNDDIYVKLAAPEAAPLRLTTDSAPDVYPAWSPDGNQIAFVRLRGAQAAVYLTSPQGGQERKVEDFSLVSLVASYSHYHPSISWSPDGQWLAVPEMGPERTSGIFLVPVAQGEKRRLASGPLSAGRFQLPTFSPNGRLLAYASCKGDQNCDLYVLELGPDLTPKGQSRWLARGGPRIAAIAWMPDGQSLVFSRESTESDSYLWRTSLSGSGQPQRMELCGRGANFPAVSRTGNRLLYAHTRRGRDIWKLEAGGAPKKFISSNFDDSMPRYAPDGTRIAFGSNRAGSGFDLWVANQDGTNPVRLTTGFNLLGVGRWSPDGRWISFNAKRRAEDDWESYSIDAAGGQARRVFPDVLRERGTVTSWSRDGKWIYFHSTRTVRAEVWRIPAAGGDAVQVTKNGGTGGIESWDGKVLYYTRGKQLWEMPVSGGPERHVLDSIGGAVRHFSYEPVENGIYWIKQVNQADPNDLELRFWDQATRTSRLLNRFQAERLQGLSVSADRRTVLTSFYPVSLDEDLMLVENFR